MYKKEKSQALIISLWILAILTILAISIGRQVSMALYLSKYQKNRLKAISLAKAGINRAIVELERDSTPNYDALNETWNTGGDSTGKSLFENVEIEQGSGETFTVTITDEERKININGIEPLGQNLLKEIFNFADEFRGLRGIKDDAEGLKNAIVDYIDDDSEAMGGGSEDEIFKNKQLKTPEELLVILEYFYKNKGVANFQEKAQEVFSTIKDLITIYGQGPVNINTVSEDVLTILANAVAGNPEQKNCVSALVDDLINVREERGKSNTDKIPFHSLEEITSTLTDSNCVTLLGNLKTQINPAFKSNNFRIESVGNVGNITKNITAIYDRGTKKTVYWHEN